MVDCGDSDFSPVLAEENKAGFVAIGFGTAARPLLQRLCFQHLAFIYCPPGIFFSQIADSPFTRRRVDDRSGNAISITRKRKTMNRVFKDNHLMLHNHRAGMWSTILI